MSKPSDTVPLTIQVSGTTLALLGVLRAEDKAIHEAPSLSNEEIAARALSVGVAKLVHGIVHAIENDGIYEGLHLPQQIVVPRR